MRFLYVFLLAVATSLGVSACQPVNTTDVLEYKIAPAVLEFPGESSTQYLNVQTTAAVDVVSDMSWCTVKEETSQSVKMIKFAVTVTDNPSVEVRNAILTVTVGGEKTETVKVIQKACGLIVDTAPVRNLPCEGGTFYICVLSSGDYDVSSDASWVCLKEKDLKGQTALFEYTANTQMYPREAVLTFSSGDDIFKVHISQKENTSLPEPDMSGMESDARTLMKKMTLGINLGNTLEAMGGETAWGAPYTTEDIILYFKSLGFNAVRIPCSWDQNLEEGEGYVVKSSWMDRVKEVVDYVVDNDMYAVLNIHWDGGWLENDILNGYDEDVDEQQRAIWTQIATTFRDYDEHLVFAGTNEPNVENAQHMETLLKYEQTFIDAVRATGGRNAYRVLIFQGPSTDVDKTVQLMKTLPEDTVEGRLAAEVHYYSPWQFCGMTKDETWGRMAFFWGNEMREYSSGAYAGRWVDSYNEEYVAGQMAKMKKKFWDAGIPVIIGEFGADSWRTCSLGTEEENRKAEEGYRKSLALFNACVIREAKANGCVPFYWHCQGDMIDRAGLTVNDQARLDAMVEAGRTPYPNN